MLYVVSTENRTYLALEPFAVKFKAAKGSIELRTYRSLLADPLQEPAAFLLCSVGSFCGPQRDVALLWEAAAMDRLPGLRILNRPSRIPAWFDALEELRSQGVATARARPLDRFLECPVFPAVLRQQTSEGSIESPIIGTASELPEVLDRMALAGGSPTEIHAVELPSEAANSGPVQAVSLLKMGEAHFTVGNVHPETLRAMESVASALPHDAVALDFIVADGKPVLWKLDDDLARLLPDLVAHGDSPRRANPSLIEALLALGSGPQPADEDLAPVDPEAIRRALMHCAPRAV
jgi:hypothetical protein